jgi:hypothetical protein
MIKLAIPSLVVLLVTFCSNINSQTWDCGIGFGFGGQCRPCPPPRTYPMTPRPDPRYNQGWQPTQPSNQGPIPQAPIPQNPTTFDSTKFEEIEQELDNFELRFKQMEYTLKNYKLSEGKAGPKGEQGEPGPRGPKGDQGEPGEIELDYDKLGEILGEKLDYNDIVSKVTSRVLQQLPEAPSPQEVNIEEITSLVIKRLPKKELYYNIKPLPVK